MVDLQKVESQLHKAGMKNRFFGKPEVRELCHILSPNEVITHAVLGQYEGGIALMVTTNYRVLLIDKKPWFLTMEDIRYDLVSEVDFYSRLIDATVSLITINKTLMFNSFRRERLRELVRYIQHKVMELRHVDDYWQPSQDGSNGAARVTPVSSQFSQLTQQQNDFISSFQTQIKRSSMAKIAGEIATADFVRNKPLIRPLYPRPSLVTRHRHGGFVAQASEPMFVKH